LPLPLLPVVMVIQLALLEAVQLQVAPAVTLTLLLPAADPGPALVGEIV
jgi:hypothetical protein